MVFISAKKENYLSVRHATVRSVDSLEVEEYSEGDEEGGQGQPVSDERQIKQIHRRLEGKYETQMRSCRPCNEHSCCQTI